MSRIGGERLDDVPPGDEPRPPEVVAEGGSRVQTGARRVLIATAALVLAVAAG